MKGLKLILPVICLFLLFVTASQAAISLVDLESSGFRTDIDIDVTQAQVSSGSGIPGDFELLMCTTVSDGGNSFLDPTPGGWTAINEGECGGDGVCILGIFQRFDRSPESSVITCNWTDPTSAVAALSLRYRGVDSDNPVIDLECAEGGADDPLTIPSVNTEPGSAVVLTYSFGFAPNIIKGLQAEPIFQGFTSAVGQYTAMQPYQQVIAAAESLIFRTGGPTGDFQFGPSGSDWRGCAIALRAAPTDIPTISEWGLGVFAALFGIAAVWALRRRAARA